MIAPGTLAKDPPRAASPAAMAPAGPATHPRAQAAWAACSAALARYARSPGLWILMLIAPIGARFMIPTGDPSSITIAIGKQLPVLTAPVIGVCLGITVSTLLLPLAYIYLRSNTNRRQPWQLLDVTPGSRVARTLGRFGADLAVLALLLAVLNAAGLFLAQIILPGGLGGLAGGGLAGAAQLSLALWLIVAPALAGLAAIRALWAAVPVLRGAGGDIAFFILWMASLVLPVAASDKRGFAAAIYDFPGFTRPLLHGTDPGRIDLQIGAATVEPGRRPVDAVAGLMSPAMPPRAAHGRASRCSSRCLRDWSNGPAAPAAPALARALRRGSAPGRCRPPCPNGQPPRRA
ncbi:hypothetical protein GVO57_13745 [Sphingomonas changnyeongensis]|uniref:ABC-2 type transport system permease protein n=1 Tax=Sphingomonas changnyeongensis TaxID=2698679 RepID=A0A7Z2S9D8_9SPHN|nr:hypothetical protein [Sphingomonas changnyeongensis]QHL91662.1 hypothetical protein GVO57_13745 [Sphingomonas changnyeongensis]